LIFVQVCGHIQRDDGLNRCISRHQKRIVFWVDRLQFIMSLFCLESSHSSSSEGHSVLSSGIPGRQKLLTA